MVREVASRRRCCGDGTTTATVLAAANRRKAKSLLPANPMDLKRVSIGCGSRGRRPRQELKKVTSNEEIAQVAPSPQRRAEIGKFSPTP